MESVQECGPTECEWAVRPYWQPCGTCGSQPPPREEWDAWLEDQKRAYKADAEGEGGGAGTEGDEEGRADVGLVDADDLLDAADAAVDGNDGSPW